MSLVKIVKIILKCVVILFLVLVFVVGPISIVCIDKYGTPQTVTVSFHKTIPGGKGRSPHIASCGYYFVKGKRYPAQTGGRLAIGTKFEIKYAPILPSQYDVIRVLPE